MTRAAPLKWSAAVSLLAILLAWPLPGEAQPQAAEVPAAAPPVQTPAAPARDSLVGLMLQIGSFQGFGGGVQVGTVDFGLRAAGGWTPVFLAVTGTQNELKFYSTFQLSPDLYVRLLSPRDTTHIGLQGGYRYNSLLGSGLAVGGYAQFGVSRALDCLISAGLLVYPDGDKRIRTEEPSLGGADFSFPGPNVNLGVSVGLLFPL